MPNSHQQGLSKPNNASKARHGPTTAQHTSILMDRFRCVKVSPLSGDRPVAADNTRAHHLARTRLEPHVICRDADHLEGAVTLEIDHIRAVQEAPIFLVFLIHVQRPRPHASLADALASEAHQRPRPRHTPQRQRLPPDCSPHQPPGPKRSRSVAAARKRDAERRQTPLTPSSGAGITLRALARPCVRRSEGGGFSLRWSR